jgi:hypothetical protein
MVLFYDILDISALNAYIIWLHLNPQWNANKKTRRRLFLKDLGAELVHEQLQHRLTIPGLSLKLKAVIEQCLKNTSGDNDDRVAAEESEVTSDRDEEVAELASKKRNRKRGRCSKCPRGHDKKVRNICAQCGMFVCDEHSSLICKSCNKK